MGNIGNNDLYKEIAEDLGVSISSCRNCINRTIDVILEHLEQGDDVTLRNFGRFSMQVTAPREARNPHTNEAVSVPARNVIKFKMSKTLKKFYNGEEAQ